MLFVFWPYRDLMDRLVDEAEGLVDSSGSVCSSSSGRIETSADQQLNILNSITASDLSGEFMPFSLKPTALSQTRLSTPLLIVYLIYSWTRLL